MTVPQTKDFMQRSPTSCWRRSPPWGNIKSVVARSVTTSCVLLGTWGAMFGSPGYSASQPQTKPLAMGRVAIANTCAPTPEDHLPQSAPCTSHPVQLSQVVAPEPERNPTIPPEQQAPSVVWLVVMPAIPIVGGALIYISRRLLGSEDEVESRILEFPQPHPAAPPDLTQSGSEDSEAPHD